MVRVDEKFYQSCEIRLDTDVVCEVSWIQVGVDCYGCESVRWCNRGS